VPGPLVRPYAPADLEALYEICLRTGASGEDASPLMDDHRLLGEIYAAPYAIHQPELAFVVDDGTGTASGYVLGALDTAAFEATLEQAWWPGLRERYPDGRRSGRLDDLFVALLHNRHVPSEEVLGPYPSHLHIDLLPPVQGQGWGRRLLDRLFEALRERGSPGVHLGVSAANERAIGFYRHLGFVELHGDPVTHTLGLRL
jgi:ribosomal protein S18 acetylase RimI-like enzyme